ncbi:hypothetical protein, partial [Haloarchaeobius litoreus]
VVGDFRSIGAGCLQHRTVFIISYEELFIKSNDWRVEYPAGPSNVVSGGVVGCIPALKGGVLALQLP